MENKKIIAIVLIVLTIASILGFNNYQKYREDQYRSAGSIFYGFVYEAHTDNSELTREGTIDTEENILKFMNTPEKYIKADGIDGMFMMAQSFEFFTGREVDWQLMLQLIYEKKFTKALYSSENSLRFKNWPNIGNNYYYYKYVKRVNEVALANGVVLDVNTPYEEIDTFLSEYTEEIDQALDYKKKQYNEGFPPGSTFGYTTESTDPSADRICF